MLYILYRALFQRYKAVRKCGQEGCIVHCLKVWSLGLDPEIYVPDSPIIVQLTGLMTIENQK